MAVVVELVRGKRVLLLVKVVLLFLLVNRVLRWSSFSQYYF
jgi:hypothetical protein